VVSFLGPLAANLLTGSIVVESIFNIPGAGAFFVNSIQNRDGFLLGGGDDSVLRAAGGAEPGGGYRLHVTWTGGIRLMNKSVSGQEPGILAAAVGAAGWRGWRSIVLAVMTLAAVVGPFLMPPGAGDVSGTSTRRRAGRTCSARTWTGGTCSIAYGGAPHLAAGGFSGRSYRSSSARRYGLWRDTRAGRVTLG